MSSPAETAYQDARDDSARIKELVLDHVPLVNRLADRLLAKVTPDTSREDLISAGTVGLVEAAHRFDPSREVKFITFAYRRVRGAMLDYLRQKDWLGRSARDRLNELREITNAFRSRHHRVPRIEELAEEADISEERVLKYLSYRKWDYVCSLDQPAEDAEHGADGLAELIAADVPSPLEKLEWREKVERLAAAIEQLPERQRQIIVMYYYEDLYMAEMAEVLDLSESRISQLHTRAIYNLSRILEAES